MMGYMYVTYLIERTGKQKAGSDKMDRRQAATGRKRQANNRLDRREAGWTGRPQSDRQRNGSPYVQ